MEMPAGSNTEWLAEPPAELLNAPLRRLGEGVGKVVYASEHWVIKRDRSPSEVVALIVLWSLLRKLKRALPKRWGARLFERPSRQMRILRVFVQAVMAVVPKSIWFTTHIRETWTIYSKRDMRGRRLADEHLKGTPLVPRTISFPSKNIRVRGWPGWLNVSQATERVECTLHSKVYELAAANDFAQVESWLDRFLELRQSGWKRGLFSVDAHLKNFGVCGDHVVLLDTGGLTDRWADIADTLAWEEQISEPHRRLGLGAALRDRPDVASRFNARWKALVSVAGVQGRWPDSQLN